MRTKHVAFLALILILPWLPACTEGDAMPLTMMSGGVPTAGGTDYTADANCMGAWFMNSSATETDRSGEGGTLTETASDDVPTSATVPGGYSGTSRDFESGDTEGLYHADGNSTDISGADQHLSIVAWVKVESAKTVMDIVCKYYTVGDLRQYRLVRRAADSGLVGYLSHDGENISKAIAADDVSDGDWHHAAMVYNDTDIRLYVDGSLSSNGADNPKAHTTGISNENSQFGVGVTPESTSSGSNFDGLIDEVAVFDRALSAAEVLEIYTDGIDGTKGGND